MSMSAFDEVKTLQRVSRLRLFVSPFDLSCQDYRLALESADLDMMNDDKPEDEVEALLKSLLFASNMHAARVKLPEARFQDTASGALQKDHEAKEIRVRFSTIALRC